MQSTSRVLIAAVVALLVSGGTALALEDRPEPREWARTVPAVTITAPPAFEPLDSWSPPTTAKPRPKARVSRSRPRVARTEASDDCGGQRERVARHFAAGDVGRACRVLVCESGGDVGARNGTHNGLMQIAGGTFDPEANIAHAAQMAYTTPKHWTHWTCR